MRIFDSILFFIAGGIAGAFACAWWMKTSSIEEKMPAAQQHILLERIKLVSKLITVQGDVVVNRSYYDERLWGFLAKELFITAKARISVGYDLKKATVDPDSSRKIIRIKNLPQPEILAIDHELQYQRIEDDMFFRFTPAELNDINGVIRKKFTSPEVIDTLKQEAENQGIETLEIIKVLVEQGGWTLEVIRENPALTNPNEVLLDPKKLPKIPQDSSPKIRN